MISLLSAKHAAAALSSPSWQASTRPRRATLTRSTTTRNGGRRRAGERLRRRTWNYRSARAAPPSSPL
eukprot:258434-Pleurochrysis_carterae.AAC.1